MQYPMFNEIPRFTDSRSQFGGYNHTSSCADGEFYDMDNMTLDNYPAISTRRRRGINEAIRGSCYGMWSNGEDLAVIHDGKFYFNSFEKREGITFSEEPHRFAKMGSKLFILPEKRVFDTSRRNFDLALPKYETTRTVYFRICDSEGNTIQYNTAYYYEQNPPSDGDYVLTTVNGIPNLKVYSSTTGSWSAVVSPFFKIVATEGTIQGFEKDMSLKVTVNLRGDTWDYVENLFPNKEAEGIYSNNFVIANKKGNEIVLPGLLDVNHAVEWIVTIERVIPDMSFVVECNNRLWGCSKDGHEIYASKLGDVYDWNNFSGISTDSWAATVGSDGVFTGATVYNGNPIFFKEDRIYRIAISSTGAHQIKETVCKGAKSNRYNSVIVHDGILYYVSSEGIMAYTGSTPYRISDKLLSEIEPVTENNLLGKWTYFENYIYASAAAGCKNKLYFYLWLERPTPRNYLCVYDTKLKMWTVEKDYQFFYMVNYKEEVLMHGGQLSEYGYMTPSGTIYDHKTQIIDGNKRMEDTVHFMLESGMISYEIEDHKYVRRLNLRIRMEFGSYFDFYIKYDDGEWEHKFGINADGTRTHTIPIPTKRCDHFRYKIIGKGDVKIYSITKSIERGSDVYV